MQKIVRLVLLALALAFAFSIPTESQSVLGASPTIDVTKLHPLNALGVTSSPTAQVETDWANHGTRLIVTVRDSDANGPPLNQAIMATVEADESGEFFSFIAEEGTGAFAGQWTFSVELTNTSTSTAPTTDADTDGLIDYGASSRLVVDDEDEVRITIQPIAGSIDFALTRRVDIENDKPQISNLIPAHRDAVDDEDVDVAFTIEDNQSGIPEPEDIPDGDSDDEYTSVVILDFDRQCSDSEVLDVTDVADLLTENCGGIGSALQNVITINDEDDFDDIVNGYVVDTAIFLDEFDEHFITILGFDTAGNFDIYDADPSENVALAHLIIDSIDPAIDSARTGVKWDPVNGKYEADREWIQVLFADETDLDPNSISKEDFVVVGRDIVDAFWFDVNPNEVDKDVDGSSFSATCSEDVSGDYGEDCRPDSWDFAVPSFESNRFAMIRNSVFLKLSTELPPDAAPDVVVIPDGVDDVAGNNQDLDAVEAMDWIGPGIVASLTTSTKPLIIGGATSLELIVTSDEDLTSNPNVQVNYVNAPVGCVDTGEILLDDGPGGSVPDNCLNSAIGHTLPVNVVQTGAREWTATISSPIATGYYNIHASGEDVEGNLGDDGTAPSDIQDDFFNIFDLPDDAEAIFFEGDVFMPNPATSPAQGESLSVTEPFQFAIDFTSPHRDDCTDAELASDPENCLAEGGEYTADNSNDVMVTKFELNGQDRLADVTTSDNKTFTALLAGTTPGIHTVTLNAQDGSGNQMSGGDLNATFNILNVLPPIFCDGHAVTIAGTDGDDIIIGTPGDDVIAGLDGNDIIIAQDGDDIVCGGKGNDGIYGQNGDDRLFGESGGDVLDGGPGDDFMVGGSDSDVLYGRNGSDDGICQGGTDQFNGGPRTDRADATCETLINVP